MKCKQCNGFRHAVIGIGRHHVVRMVFQYFRSVGHGDTETRTGDHIKIILRIPDGHDFIPRDRFFLQQQIHTAPFCHILSGDLQIVLSPAGDGQPVIVFQNLLRFLIVQDTAVSGPDEADGDLQDIHVPPPDEVRQIGDKETVCTNIIPDIGRQRKPVQHLFPVAQAVFHLRGKNIRVDFQSGQFIDQCRCQLRRHGSLADAFSFRHLIDCGTV